MASKKTAKPVRVAVIGTGGISWAHAKGYATHAGKISVVAICDNVESKLQPWADNLKISPAMYTDWKKMLREMKGKLDAVDICLPHHLHAPAILDAVAAGLHVMCEKPMCISLKQADQIAAAVKSAGVTYMSAHNQMFMPVVQHAKRMIDAGEIGRVRWLRSQDCFIAGNTEREGWGWRANMATQGGGELIDTGYHPSYRLLHLAGSPVVDVRSTMGRFALNIDGEDTASVQVRFANGAIGEILTSWTFNNPHGSHQIHVIGDKGQIFGSENTLYFLPKGFSEPAKINLSRQDTFETEIGHFADCLINGSRPIHSVEEGRAVLELILAAADSADGWQKTAVRKSGAPAVKPKAPKSKR